MVMGERAAHNLQVTTPRARRGRAGHGGVWQDGAGQGEVRRGGDESGVERCAQNICLFPTPNI